ncbi:hypothetical protein ACB092_12G196100 [Castanea dentata]
MKPANGKGLAVGGFASLERVGTRVFCSAAISKRHDAITLETADGINTTISNCINMSLTHQNGFASEVCNHFLCGFPYNWEEYAVGCSGDKHRVLASNEFNMSSENCLLTKSIFNDVLGKFKGNSPMKNVDSGSDETPVNQMETKVDYKFDNDNTILNSRDLTKEEHQKASCHSEMGMNVLSPTRVACKRSSTRLKNSGMKPEVVSSNSR